MKQFINQFLVLLTLMMLSVANQAVASDRNPILPVPQYIQYGEGILSISQLSIGFERSPSEEDIFTANELIRMIREECGVEIALNEKSTSSANLIFKKLADAPSTPQLDEKVGRDSREAYQIAITPTGVLITAKSSTGLYYAVQTLRQMVVGEDELAYFPVATVEDWPKLAYRGFMMDMTHMQFPTVDEIKRQLDFLALWKTNQYYFYSETNIELESYPLLIPNARFSKEQMEDIIAYAEERHIDIVPNLNLYGHLHDFFKYEHYADLAATPYGREFSTTDPRVNAIVSDWVKQFAELFPSPFFHIGFDETWLIELEAKKVGSTVEDVYLKMLERTASIVEAKGKKVMLYADMLQKYPNAISNKLSNNILVAWHYGPLKEETYREMLEPFKQFEVPIFVQSATLNWKFLYPATSVSFRNHRLLLNEGMKYGARGFINSGWTDDSQVLMRSSRPDMAYGSSVAWNNVEIGESDFFDKYTTILYPAVLSDIIKQAHLELSKADRLTRSALGSTTNALWDNPFSEKSLEIIRNHKDKLKAARLASEEAQILLRQALPHHVDSITLFAMLTGARELDMLTMRYLFAGRISDIHEKYQEKRDLVEFRRVLAEATAFFSSLTVDMFDVIVETKEMFREAWLNEYTTYRLGIPMSKFDRELDFWFGVQNRLKTLVEIPGDERLPPLSELLDMD